MYQGKDSTKEHSPRIIVKEFADQIDKYHPQQPSIFVADSYYGSLEAAYDLHYRKFGCLFSCKANMPSRLFSQHLHETLAKSEWKEIHNREMSAITFWNKAKVNLITNLMNGGKSMTSKSTTKVLPSALYYYYRK